MTAPLSPAPALTAEEAARVAVFDAAEEPEEVTVERVARAICEADQTLLIGPPWSAASDRLRRIYRSRAQVAIHALR